MVDIGGDDVAEEYAIGELRKPKVISGVLMTGSFMILVGYFLLHMRRVARDIASSVQVFEIGDADSLMDFTISEREGGESQNSPATVS